jgi:hypothetical protein
VDVDDTIDSLTSQSKETTPFDARRRRNAKNVGGWVSPTFAKEIDRNWLNGDRPPERFDLRKYVPQVGDIVL